MTSQTTSIYTPFADGRPVRDIVEHTPALVNETWCRNLLRHTLDSLEQQYASGAPHRAITPDTLVMLANGEALLMPSIDEGATSTPSLAGDLHALALVVHYAITAESPPDGPLGPRLYDNYSEQLTKGLDSCLGPNRRLRPNTVDEMRTLLGIEAGALELPPAAGASVSRIVLPVEPPAASAPADVRADDSASVHAQPSIEPAPQEITAPLTVVEPPAPDFAAPVAVPPPVENPVPEPVAVASLDTASIASVPREEPAADSLAATPAAMLRKPATQDSLADEAHPARSTPIPASPAPAAPHKPSATPAAGAQDPYASAPQAWATTDRSSRLQRWGMLAGAAIVVLAAGSALVSYLQQSDDVVALSPPPAERAPAGLDKGETVVAPPASVPAAPATEPATAAPTDAAADTATGTPADPAAAGTAPAPAETGRALGAVVNGTTYKLVIKPWGTVYVDGVDRGVSPPIKRLTLAPGQHTIRIVNPSFPEHIMTVDAGAKETMNIQHDFTAKAE
ncbi:PEGA domain-containing protein [Massilia litorea]|uniref:PEGA domain-containing protein n=1 Tax=Massilia litorea TaxID=2769491 RepID=A0A7L9TZ93_9BURK|nr:PEGA domain-containing protein [Massilia litorea]QOL48101.1 PEGA domain-containing protein [Massilia litorea]